MHSGEEDRFLMAISVKLDWQGCGLIWSSTLALPPGSLEGGDTESSAGKERGREEGGEGRRGDEGRRERGR